MASLTVPLHARGFLSGTGADQTVRLPRRRNHTIRLPELVLDDVGLRSDSSALFDKAVYGLPVKDTMTGVCYEPCAIAPHGSRHAGDPPVPAGSPKLCHTGAWLASCCKLQTSMPNTGGGSPTSPGSRRSSRLRTASRRLNSNGSTLGGGSPTSPGSRRSSRRRLISNGLTRSEKSFFPNRLHGYVDESLSPCRSPPRPEAFFSPGAKRLATSSLAELTSGRDASTIGRNLDSLEKQQNSLASKKAANLEELMQMLADIDSSAPPGRDASTIGRNLDSLEKQQNCLVSKKAASLEELMQMLADIDSSAPPACLTRHLVEDQIGAQESSLTKASPTKSLQPCARVALQAPQCDVALATASHSRWDWRPSVGTWTSARKRSSSNPSVSHNGSGFIGKPDVMDTKCPVAQWHCRPSVGTWVTRPTQRCLDFMAPPCADHVVVDLHTTAPHDSAHSTDCTKSAVFAQLFPPGKLHIAEQRLSQNRRKSLPSSSPICSSRDTSSRGVGKKGNASSRQVSCSSTCATSGNVSSAASQQGSASSTPTSTSRLMGLGSLSSFASQDDLWSGSFASLPANCSRIRPASACRGHGLVLHAATQALHLFGNWHAPNRRGSNRSTSSTPTSSVVGGGEDSWGLHRAARDGNVSRVDELLASSTNAILADRSGITALHLASQGKHAEIVQQLLCAGASADAATIGGKADTSGITALHAGAFAGSVAVVRHLLDAKATVSRARGDGVTPLHLAAQGGHADVVDLLLAAGASVRAVGSGDFTPLHDAAHAGHEVIVRALLQARACPDAATAEDTTALHSAARCGHAGVSQALLDAGASCSVASVGGFLPLHDAAHAGHLAVVLQLLHSRATPQVKSDGGATALHLATRAGHKQVAGVLARGHVNVMRSLRQAK